MLKNPIQRDRYWVKGKIALLRKLAILGRRQTHVPGTQVLTAIKGPQFLKGGFRSSQVGGYMYNSTGGSCNHLEIGHVMV